jgi:hypothetical protein
MNINLGNLMENVQRTPEFDICLSLQSYSDADFPVLSLAAFPFYGHIHHVIIMVYSVFSCLSDLLETKDLILAGCGDIADPRQPNRSTHQHRKLLK